jgi:hypothetical protein
VLLDVAERDFNALSQSLMSGGPLAIDKQPGTRPSTRHRRNMRATLLRLHGPFCWLCGKEIVDEAPTLDHIVPRSKGGRGAIVNMRLAHRSCNERRSSGPVPVLVLTDEMRLTGTTTGGQALSSRER